MLIHAEEMRNKCVIGVDEVGRGPLAGPVVVAVARITDFCIASRFNIRDSKKLSKKARVEIFKHIPSFAEFEIGCASVHEIEKYNISNATKLAINRAIIRFGKAIDVALIDGNYNFNFNLPIQFYNIIDGDNLYISIATASIIAKECRDRLMVKLAERYSEYGFEKNAGYGTKAHIEALYRYGYTKHHRIGFEPLRSSLVNMKKNKKYDMANRLDHICTD